MGLEFSCLCSSGTSAPSRAASCSTLQSFGKTKNPFFMHPGPAQLLQVSNTTGGPSCNLPQIGTSGGKNEHFAALIKRLHLCVCP